MSIIRRLLSMFSRRSAATTTGATTHGAHRHTSTGGLAGLVRRFFRR